MELDVTFVVGKSCVQHVFGLANILFAILLTCDKISRDILQCINLLMVKRCFVTALVKCVPSVMNSLTEHFFEWHEVNPGGVSSLSDVQGSFEDTRRSLRFLNLLKATKGGCVNTFFILSD